MRNKRAARPPSRRPVAPQAVADSSSHRYLKVYKAIAVIVSLAVVISFLIALQVRHANDRPASLGAQLEDTATPTSAVTHDAPQPEEGSLFLNMAADIAFVGSQACIVCHQEEHASFHRTGMARSMAPVDLSREPIDGSFEHPASQRRYEVRRAEGQMWHREFRTKPGADDLLLQEHPVTYVTGSGRHALTYVVEADGFLVESPITWYSSRQAWGMSPGYDRPNHQGFQREVGETCLVCHAGQVQTIDRSLHRVRVVEASIGCERCHGPGSLHVTKHSEVVPSSASDNIDHTIVNPKHLRRDLAEAVCQQCHLRAAATVLRAGKRAADFRPGMPLQSIRHDYALEGPKHVMKVVGHVEQMHASACYRGSDRFTCVTCHHPHGEPNAEERTAHYRGDRFIYLQVPV